MNKSFWLATIFLSFFLILFSFYTINLSTADIGRHITNGSVFLHSAEYGVSKADILYTNFFSYTHPDFPFINHHWASGVAIYLIYSLLGFSGLSLIYFLLVLGALLFAIATVRNHADMGTLLFVGVFLTPLIAGRTEVRPEGLSYLLIAFFIYFLYRYSKSLVSCRYLFILPLLMLLWANSHIYFIFGIFIVGVFLAEALLFRDREKIRRLAPTLLASIVAACVTPYGIQGILYPFTIFQNYGYRIVENQSISFLENLSFINPEFLWYKITLALVVASSIFIFIKKRESFLWALTFISLTFAILGYFGIRHIPVFALVSLPLLAYNLSIIKKFFHREREIDQDIKIIIYVLLFCILLGITLFQFRNKLPWNRNFEIGIKAGELMPIEFVKNTGINGPFFNNYDIGGMMIFGLYPKEKIFVDNRPEAYPREFFEHIYVPMQEDDAVWERELEKHKFNAIFFYRLDYTPWAQKFLIERVQDPAWAPVFVDDKTIIFLFRNEKNAEIITEYEIPKEAFILEPSP